MRSCSSSPTRWKGASYETPPQQARAILGEVSHEGHKVSDGNDATSRYIHHISQKTLCHLPLDQRSAHALRCP